MHDVEHQVLRIDQPPGAPPTPTRLPDYYAAGRRVALRENNDAPQWLVGDHLGSTSLTLNSAGGKDAELRYRPFGSTCYTAGTTPTERRFTGQIEDTGTGLYFYNARYYDPALGRFTQPDTIVPEPGNPQAFNRYSYVYNNPVKYTDPSGHDPATVDNACSSLSGSDADTCYEMRWYLAHGYTGGPGSWKFTGKVSFLDFEIASEFFSEAGLTLMRGKWQKGEVSLLGQTLLDFGQVIGGLGQIKSLLPSGSQTGVYRSRNARGGRGELMNFKSGGGTSPFITVYADSFKYAPRDTKAFFLHEIAHAIDYNSGRRYRNELPAGRPALTEHSDPLQVTNQRTYRGEYFADAVTLWVYPGAFPDFFENPDRTQKSYLYRTLSALSVTRGR